MEAVEEYKLIPIPYQGTSLCISKLSKFLVYGSREGHVVVYDQARDMTLLDLGISNSSLWNVHMSPNETLIIAGGATGSLYRASFPDGTVLPAFTGHTAEINHCVFNADGSLIYTGSDDGTVRKWNSLTGKSDVLVDHGQIIYAFDLSKDENFSVSGDGGGNVKVLNLRNDELTEMNILHSIWCVKVSQLSRFVVAGDSGGILTVWTIAGSLIRSIEERHTDRLRSVDISADEKYFASTGNDHLIKIWRTGDWEEEVTYDLHSDWNKTVVFDNENKTWTSISDDRHISVVRTPEVWGGKTLSRDGEMAFFHVMLKHLLVFCEGVMYVCDVLTGDEINSVRICANRVVEQVDVNSVGKIVVCAENLVMLVNPFELKKEFEIEVCGKVGLGKQILGVAEEGELKVYSMEDLGILYSVEYTGVPEAISVFEDSVIVCSRDSVLMYKDRKFDKSLEVVSQIQFCIQYNSKYFILITNKIEMLKTKNFLEVHIARYIQNPIEVYTDLNFLYLVTKSSVEIYSLPKLILQEQVVFHRKIRHCFISSDFQLVCKENKKIFLYKQLTNTYHTQQKENILHKN